MIFNRFDSALGMRLFAGEAPTIELQLTGATGLVESTFQRVVKLVTYGRFAGEVLDTVVGVPASDASGAYWFFAISSTQTQALTDVVEPRYSIFEDTADGAEIYVDAQITVTRRPSVPVGTAIAGGSASRFILGGA